MGIPVSNLCFSEPEKERASFGAVSPLIDSNTQSARRECIKVIAVGGGGSNALNHIISKGIEGVELLAVNTDVRCLDMSLSERKIILGERITKGLGAGARPEVGEQAARESLPEIRAFLKGADMVYLAAGMGGGTGTGATSIIAEAAKEMGILTVAVVTKPFKFEGTRRMRYAEDGIRKLRSHVDALIVVPNEKLLEISDRTMTLPESLCMADEVLRQAVQGVTDLVTRPGMINVDFADLRTVMKQAGTAIMGVGRAKGENRIIEALKEALESPLMECSMQGARGVLMNITCGLDLGLFEVQEAASYIENVIAEDATFVWGCAEDSSMDGVAEIVVVATGFDDALISAPMDQKTPVRQNVPQARGYEARRTSAPVIEPVNYRPQPTYTAPAPAPAPAPIPEAQMQESIAAKSMPHIPDWLADQNEKKADEKAERELLSTLDVPTFSRQNRISRTPQSKTE